MKILFVSSWFPYPPNNGSRIRVFNLIKQLSKDNEISLVSLTQPDFQNKHCFPLAKYCKKIEKIKWQIFSPDSFKAKMGFLNLIPRSLFATYDPKLKSLIERQLVREKFDVIIFFEIGVILYARKIKGIPKVLEEAEISIMREQPKKAVSFLKKIRTNLTWFKSRIFLRFYLRNFDACTVVSQKERESFLNVFPKLRIKVISNGVDVNYCSFQFKKLASKQLIYSGALSFFANLEGVQFFLKQIFPLIKVKIPDIKLIITGKNDNVQEKIDLGSSIKLTGYIDDIRPYIVNSDICIVPLKVGGGTRLKILEAMALGTPVVSTSKGAEGLKGLYSVNGSQSTVNSKANIWIEDEPEKFAKAVVKLIRNRELARQMAINARKLVEERYDWNKIGEKFEKFIRKVVEKKKDAVKSRF